MKRWSIAVSAIALLGATTITPAAPPDFRYDPSVPLAVRSEPANQHARIDSRELHFTTGTQRTAATFVRPRRRGKHAGVLFVHWLGDPKTSNRSEFFSEARDLARHGATSLLIDAMWAKPDWFDIRTPSTDYARSIAQVIAIRRALDLLIAQPDVDPNRIAYVGHDFGAMYGALVAGADSRPRAYVFMTPTSSLWEWYLLGTRPHDKYAYIAKMRALDPTTAVARASAMRGSLLQFATHDDYVSAAAADEFIAAVPVHGRTVKRYAAGHDLHIAAARTDRLAWLRAQLSLR